LLLKGGGLAVPLKKKYWLIRVILFLPLAIVMGFALWLARKLSGK